MAVFVPKFLRKLLDVAFGTLADNDLVAYDQASDTFKNKSAAALGLATAAAVAAKADRDAVWADKIPGVTGAGTSADPWKGWGATVGSTPGRYYFRAGVFEEDQEVLIAVPGVSCLGAGVNHTVIRCRDARAGKSVFYLSRPTAVEARYLEFGNFTLDATGNCDYGLRLRDTNFSTFRPLRIINAKSWLMRSTRGVGNTWDAIRYHFQDADVTLVTPNGIYLSEADAIQPDNATTTNTFNGVEIAGCTGTGLEIHNAFGVVFNAGAVEECAVNLLLGDDTFNCVFNGTDFEPRAVGGSVVRVSGSNHQFNRGNWVGTPVQILAGSTGGHVFDRIYLPGAVSDDGSGVNDWWWPDTSPAVARVTGSNRRNNIQRWGTAEYRIGPHTRRLGSYPSQDGSIQAGVVGWELLNSGSRQGGIYQVPGGALYFANTGGFDQTSAAAVAASSGLWVDGLNVGVAGSFNVGGVQVTQTGAANPAVHLKTVDDGLGNQAPLYVEMLVNGQIVGHIVQDTNFGALYGLNTGGIADFARTTLESKFGWKVFRRAFVHATVVNASVTGTYTPDASAGNNFALTLVGPTTLANPTNPTDGQTIVCRLKQDGTGGRTLALGGAFRVPGGVTVQASKSAGAVDVLVAQYSLADAKWDVLEWVNEQALRPVQSLAATFSGGGSVLAASGEKARIFVDVDCDITEWELIADQAGTLALDVRRCTRGTYPGSLATIITTGAPTLSSQAINFATSPNWATGLSAGDVLEVSINGTPATVTWAKLTLKVRRK